MLLESAFHCKKTKVAVFSEHSVYRQQKVSRKTVTVRHTSLTQDHTQSQY